tara:strand:- start:436 stop:822 length:387 start_codon:yes stop_codon:yes gene_type:complete
LSVSFKRYCYLATERNIMVKSVFDETYELLNSIGVVATQTEFYRDWLNKSESYFRCLRFHKRQPSTQTIAICSSKLKHYSRLLEAKGDNKSKLLANDFSNLSQNLDDVIYSTSKSKWMRNVKEKETLH